MSRWKRVNTAAGYLVFGLPALVAVPALFATVRRFGLWDTVAAATLPLLWVVAPLALWARYIRRRPSSGAGWLAWLSCAVVVLLMLAVSPIWFWSGPAMTVLLSEIARARLAGRRPRMARIPTLVGQLRTRVTR